MTVIKFERLPGVDSEKTKAPRGYFRVIVNSTERTGKDDKSPQRLCLGDFSDLKSAVITAREATSGLQLTQAAVYNDQGEEVRSWTLIGDIPVSSPPPQAYALIAEPEQGLSMSLGTIKRIRSPFFADLSFGRGR